MGSVVDTITGKTGRDSARASKDASALQAQATVDAAQIAADQQQAALDFYKESTAPMRAAQAAALPEYQNMIMNPASTESLLSRAEDSGMYSALLEGREEAAARAAAATGGLRSGQAISDISSVQNQALLQAYQNEQAMDAQKLAGLGALAGLDTGASTIASMMSGIGQTQAQGTLGSGTALAQGITGAAQAQQQSAADQISLVSGIGELGIGAALAFSDERLKDSIVKVGSTNHPLINRYKWVWNEQANKLGMSGNDAGYLAGEIENVWPGLVFVHESGYKQIDKSLIEAYLENLNG